MYRKPLSAIVLALAIFGTFVLAVPNLTGAEESSGNGTVSESSEQADDVVLSTAARPTYTLDRTKLPFVALPSTANG